MRAAPLPNALLAAAALLVAMPLQADPDVALPLDSEVPDVTLCDLRTAAAGPGESGGETFGGTGDTDLLRLDAQYRALGRESRDAFELCA